MIPSMQSAGPLKRCAPVCVALCAGPARPRRVSPWWLMPVRAPVCVPRVGWCRPRSDVCPRRVSPVCGACQFSVCPPSRLTPVRLPVCVPVVAVARPSPGVCPTVFVASQIPGCVPVVAARCLWAVRSRGVSPSWLRATTCVPGEWGLPDFGVCPRGERYTEVLWCTRVTFLARFSWCVGSGP